MKTHDNFEPKIIGFLCNWCSYAGADLAGTSRMQYPASVRIIRVMCSGRVNPLFVLKAFQKGADGVLVSGCHPGDCHYMKGNYYAKQRFEVLKELLAFTGIEPQRFRLEWVSASEGTKFKKIIDEMTSDLKKLGPLEI